MSNFSFYSPISVSNSLPAKPRSVLLFHNQIQLRFLNPSDYDIVKELCEEWFPVEYPAKWFEAITSDTNLFSLAAILDGRIVGLIVAELKQGRELNREDRDISCESQMKFSAYILSLGVVHEVRVHKFLPYYYSIGGKAKDGFTYVLYLNGGHGPWNLQEYINHFFKVTVLELCSLPQWCLSQIRRMHTYYVSSFVIV